MTTAGLWVVPMASVAFVCSVSSIVISILDRGVTRNAWRHAAGRNPSDSED